MIIVGGCAISQLSNLNCQKVKYGRFFFPYFLLGMLISHLWLWQALVLQQKGDLLDLVDQRLGSKFNKKEAIRMTKVALLCTNPSPSLRPIMSEVVKMLEGRADVPEFVMGPSVYADGFGALRNQFDQISHQDTSENQSLIQSSDGLWTSSSSTSGVRILILILISMKYSCCYQLSWCTKSWLMLFTNWQF